MRGSMKQESWAWTPLLGLWMLWVKLGGLYHLGVLIVGVFGLWREQQEINVSNDEVSSCSALSTLSPTSCFANATCKPSPIRIYVWFSKYE
jgi:hypothetical protein